MLKRSYSVSCFLAGMVLLAMASQVSAQAPAITYTTPLALKPGQPNDLKIHGGALVGPTQLWTSFAAQTVLKPDVPMNGMNAAECVYSVTVASDVPVGIYGVRVATANGTSPIRLVVVDDLPSVAQAAGNGVPTAAQALTLPTAVDGQVSNLSQHYFKFTVAAGQLVTFDLLARRIGSTLDPMIRLLDAKGRELAYSDDVPGLRSDSRLCYQFKDAGEYMLEVRDIRFQGSANHFFRLRIGDFPCVTVPYPLAVKKGAAGTVNFAGLYLDGVQPTAVNFPADAGFAWASVGAKRANGASSGFAQIAVSDRDEFLETEPNDDPKAPNRTDLAQGINGRFDKVGDIDHFVFAAKKGQAMTFSGITRRQGSPAALMMRLLNAAGGQLAAKEDFGAIDPTFDFTFPEDGDYTLAVQDLHRQGGTQYAYRIVATPVQTGFTLSASADTLNVVAGGTSLITVTAARKGYAGTINVSAIDLPAGVTSSPTFIGPGRDNAVLTLRSTPEAAAGKVSLAKIVGTASINNAEYKAVSSVSPALTALFAGLPWPPQNLTESFAVGVAPKMPISLTAEPAELVFGRDLSATVKIKVARQEKFDEAVTIAVIPAAPAGLPAGITAAVKPIAKGTNEIDVVFTANAQAPLGEFTVVLTGAINQNNVNTTQPTPGITLRMRSPFEVAVKLDADKMARGGTLKGKVTIDRNPAFKGPITLTLANLPKGVTAAPATVAEGAAEAEIVLTAAADAAQGAVNNINVQGNAMNGAAKLAGTSPNITLTVE
ncbi:MAG: hypothetical protein FJ302_14345 [Planctomycetes bacterium]|nr:hypothetical protein [Planctomycetota bacterium]